ncbi:hypothetical protein ACFXC9_17135 [Streptomyces naganishii]|uniref:hypothetical protein n=1 Tax=Streptomyces naganishii TaxID=285447 RepID=UPI00368BC3DF
MLIRPSAESRSASGTTSSVWARAECIAAVRAGSACIQSCPGSSGTTRGRRSVSAWVKGVRPGTWRTSPTA